jgi:hypothetical protein
MIQSIPTKYKGITFRSRIEARAAVFFDSLDIQWQFEKEGYVFNIAKNMENGRLKKQDRAFYDKKHRSGFIPYLPDFYFPAQERFEECFIEIKGKPPTDEERDKARLLCHESKLPVYFLWDFPFIDGDFPFTNNNAKNHIDGYIWTEKGIFDLPNADSFGSLAWGYDDCFCEYGGQIFIANECYFSCKIGDSHHRVDPCIDAYNKARNEKF